MTPFYRHLEGVPGFGGASIDKVGGLAVLGVGATFAAHGLIQIMRHSGGKFAPVTPKTPTKGDA
jgi:hypothetical protein